MSSTAPADRALLTELAPKSIAIVGASETPGKAGERRTRSLIAESYQGKIYPINLNRETIFGLKAYPSIVDIPEKNLDLALILVAPQRIRDTLEQCVEVNTKVAIIITAGEDTDGEEPLSDFVAKLTKRTGMRVIGPNCSGTFLSASNVNCLGIPDIPKGKIGLISQSGNIIDSMIHFAQSRHIGFSSIFAAGNCYDVQAHEFLSILANDDNTKVIACYLESIPQASEFLRVARDAIAKKPIIALVVGQTEAGQKAAHSHTKALAQDFLVTSSSLYQAGVLQVDTPDEMASLATALCHLPPIRGERVAILSEGGGDNSIAADQVVLQGLTVPELSVELQSELRKHLLDGMPAHNPIDYGGVAEENPDKITQCVKVLMQSDEVDVVIITGFFGGFHQFIAPEILSKEVQAAKDLAAVAREHSKPLIVQSCFAYSNVPPLETLKELHIPVFESIKRAAEICNFMSLYSVFKDASIHKQAIIEIECDSDTVSKKLQDFTKTDRTVLLETESRELLSYYKVPLLEAELVRDETELLEASNTFGFPLALKIVSEAIVHKSDAGGIKLNIGSTSELTDAYAEILENASSHTNLDNVEGVLVSPMAPKGIELIIGFIRDESFGPVLMLGMGGIYVEVFKDISLRTGPFYEEDLARMISELQSAPLLFGTRGKPPIAVDMLVETMRAIATLADNHPEIKELDLNPVLVNEHGVYVLDSRILLG